MGWVFLAVIIAAAVGIFSRDERKEEEERQGNGGE